MILMAIIPNIYAQYSKNSSNNHTLNYSQSQSLIIPPIQIQNSALEFSNHYVKPSLLFIENDQNKNIQMDNTFKKIGAYVGEYLLAEVSFIGGAFLTAMLDWGTDGNPLFYYGTMLPVTFFSPLLVHKVGKSSHPQGKIWHALIGSLVSTIIWETAIYFGSPERASNQFMEMSPLYVIPLMGVLPVLSYNLFSKAK